MKTLFRKNLDIVDHAVNADIEKIASIVEGLTDNAKKAQVPTYDEQEQHPNSDFALVLFHPEIGERQKYACFNSELTELNIAFLADQVDELPEEVVKVAATNLTCAAVKYNLTIPESLQKYASKKFVDRVIDVSTINELEYTTKISHAHADETQEDTKYALNGKYPITTKEHVKKASDWFNKNFNKLSTEDQLEFVSNITKQASVLGVDFEKTAAISSFAELDTDRFNEDFYSHINTRKGYIADDQEDIIENYNHLLRSADELGTLKTAYVLELVDKDAGLDQLYGTNILDPLHAVMGTTKIASRYIDEIPVSLGDLKNLDTDELTAIVGNSVVSELRSDDGLDVLESLPTPIRKEVLGLL